SLDSALLAPLFDILGIQFHSLQKIGDTHPAIASRFTRDWRDDLTSFSATASILTQLDLVITVDTAVAHLAGAMGRPVWVMLPFAADWRWLRGRDDSPWYPTMQLFRQIDAGDWNPVIAALRDALCDMTPDS
ncbi:MAG: glycosyltransferase family 9 protein, partial [Alphaproteobacteria bacterium]